MEIFLYLYVLSEVMFFVKNRANISSFNPCRTFPYTFFLSLSLLHLSYMPYVSLSMYLSLFLSNCLISPSLSLFLSLTHSLSKSLFLRVPLSLPQSLSLSPSFPLYEYDISLSFFSLPNLFLLFSLKSSGM
jgi:hypothetical protein